MKKKKKQARKVIPTIYIIEADVPAVGVFDKVGFTDLDNTSRPDGLIKEYQMLHPNNKVKRLAFIQLPLLRKAKYFDDNMVRAELVSLNPLAIKTVDPKFIAANIGVDGKNEFVEVLNSNVDIVSAVQNAIASLAKDKANFKYDLKYRLNYDGQTHKISGSLITDVEDYLGYKVAAKHYGSNIMFIGQPDPQWLASVALTNNIYCLTDDADERPMFDYPALNDTINYVNNIEEIIDMKKHFNLIISNPVYGSTGANITDKIRDQVSYDEFVNLLPANDYERNETKDLFNYQSNMRCVTKTNTTSSDKKFKDAVITTHIARIHKTKVNNLTASEFRISQYIDRSLDKYFTENNKRSHYAIDAMPSTGYTKRNITTPWEVDKTFIIGLRDMNHKHLPYGKDTDTYKWNVLETINFDDLKPAKSGQLFISNLNFNTAVEKQNFVKFIYDNFKFISKVFTALNCDGTVHSIAFPKVDWTRAWTLEEILIEFGYTQDEITEIVNSLKAFKDMD